MERVQHGVFYYYSILDSCITALIIRTTVIKIVYLANANHVPDTVL